MKLVWLLLAIPAAYFLINRSVAYLVEKNVFEGDKVETRDCRECLGKGHDEKYRSDFTGVGMNCMACLGTGRIEVIVPGPQRPTKIWGAVVDWKDADHAIANQCPKYICLPLSKSIILSSEEKSIRGSLAGVRVKFKCGSDTVDVKTDSGGRFHCILSPGRYSVEVKEDGFTNLESVIDIKPLFAPIWLEKNKVLRERSSDERRSTDGVAVVILLARRIDGEGMLRTFLIPE